MNEREPIVPLISLGELRAQWREQYICLRCSHHAVCKVAGALGPNFLVVISQCLAFKTAEPDPEEPR